MSHKRNQAGFTLIEIMVALVVFSLAALALIRLEGATLRSTAMLDRTLLADIVARDVAINAMTDARPPALGLSTGGEVNGGRRWTWTRAVSRLGDGDVLRIEVAVSDPGGQQLGHLVMIRPPDAAGAAAR